MEKIIVYGADVTSDGWSLGKESKARCNTAIEYMRKNDQQSFVILLGAGMYRDHPVQLKQLMCWYLREQMVAAGYYYMGDDCFEKETQLVKIKLAPAEDAWGTFHESLAVLHTAQTFSLSKEITCVSSSYHLMRVRIVWKFFSYTTQSVAYKMPFSLQRFLLERVKVLKVLILGVHYRLFFQ